MDFSKFLDLRTPEKKILIADSVKNANRLVRKSGKVLFNVEIKTLQSIATEAIAADYAKKGIMKKVQVLNDRACAYIVYGILKENRPDFLPGECLDINTAAGFLKVINMIRRGVPKLSYENETSKKISELKNVITHYEDYLAKNDIYDYARLLSIGTKLYNFANVSYYVLESKNRSKKEIELAEFLAKGKETVTYLNDKLPEKYNYRLAYGVENEVIAVADTIVSIEEKLGSFAVYYTSEEYDSVIQGVFESKGIPCRLTSGISASQTNLVSLMLNILNWARDKYLYKSLACVMSSPIIRLSEDNASSVYRQYTSALDSSLVYGIENYEEWLKNKKDAAKNYTSDNKTEQEIEAERKNKYDYIALMENLVAVFSGERDLPGLFTALLGFVKENSNNRYFEEKKMLYNRLSSVAEELKYYENASMDENIETLIAFLSDLKMSYSERTDEVLAIRLSMPEVLERKHNFFIGLSALQFNSNIAESPILSDAEITKYLDDENLISSNINEIKRRNLEDTLKTADADADITLSSIMYDTVEMKPATPAPVYMKLLHGDKLPDKIDGYDNIPDKSVMYKRFDLTGPLKPRTLNRDFDKTRDVSASSFQTLLECPQRFFLSKVIDLYETEFKERDAGSWLAPNEIGTYCHAVLEEYVREVIIKGKSNSFDEAVFSGIFDEEFKRAEEEVFCDSDNVKKAVKKAKKRSLKSIL